MARPPVGEGFGEGIGGGIGEGIGGGIGERIAEALWAACHPGGPRRTSVWSMGLGAISWSVEVPGIGPGSPVGLPTASGTRAADSLDDVDGLLVQLFTTEGPALVRLARLFVDDRNAAEDLVQEAFIRLARAAHRITDGTKAAAYLRSIVLNLVRDHNRRGLVSLRHRLPFDDRRAQEEDPLEVREEHRAVIDALRELPHRQRSCLVLRYYQELGIDDIAATLGISRNSVKTHLQRGLAAMESRVDRERP